MKAGINYQLPEETNKMSCWSRKVTFVAYCSQGIPRLDSLGSISESRDEGQDILKFRCSVLKKYFNASIMIGMENSLW